ncbi:Serine/threonine-protein kinase PknF [Gemmata sp. SH-PL17]|uniref:protein kinase domain-containing protein n=1 Tax=Gemmata sp. SH-PL17 TaxID=1630693 RepID=UPI00078E0CA0|nr:protein kinase [Gemmata sp. SH-PL17]AMV27092.1 Serine/threonine-protein kinase PknF [Gemmata sp. SH-PL17]
MPLVSAPDCGTHSVYTKSAGYAPLPGYVLLEPLGRGGFGEVWKCEAPGGLHKAIKFVTGDSDGANNDSAQLRQELEAFQQVKAIRHPFLLSLERVELVGAELVMVMELADKQLGDRFEECRGQGLPGIPRQELLGYLREAAEALDVIGAKYGLQHLDVKPANLFLTAGHVQVGDYGLVSKLDTGKSRQENRGLTPRYAAPEVLCGQVHTRSDQYSLALVYYELLTGTFPFNGRSVQQMMLQHMTAAPDLNGLAPPDRAAVATALAKKPDDRFASCADFINALCGGTSRSVAALAASLLTPSPRGSGSITAPPSSAPTRGVSAANEPTLRNVPHFVTPAATPAPQPVPPKRVTYTQPAPAAATVERAATRTPQPKPAGVCLEQILSVVPIAWLQGKFAQAPGRPPTHLVNAVLRAAETEAGINSAMGAVNRDRDGTWGCRFLSSIDPRVAQVKLDLLWEEGGVTMDSRTEGRVEFRKLAPVPAPTGWFSSKPKAPDSGLQVIVELPDPGAGTGEVVVTGTFFGNPPSEFAKSGEKTIVKLIEGIRRTLNDTQDRRKHPRVPATFPLTLYPLQSDGQVEPPMKGFCRDVSAGGMALFCATEPTTKYMFVEFEGVPGTTGLAVLLQTIASEWQHDEVLVTGKYRLEFGPTDG